MCTSKTKAGPFTVIAARTDSSEATVLASGWTDAPTELVSLIVTPLRPQSITRVKAIEGITERVLAYHAGDLRAIDAVRVEQRSGAFIERVWDRLRRLEAGAPVTYTELARLGGRSGAARAAGSACSRNAAALFVPCHRVVPMGGGVGWFRWGADVKRWLLEHEA